MLGEQRSPPCLTLLLGGSRSGKSQLGEALIEEEATRTGVDAAYIATAEAFDQDMRDRIAAHIARRSSPWRPMPWHTVEEPRDLAGALTSTAEALVLVDCLSMWLYNLIQAAADISSETEKLLAGLKARTLPTVLISSEVGLGIVPDTQMWRRFRDEQGRVNQQVAAVADCVALMVAGLPIRAKPR